MDYKFCPKCGHSFFDDAGQPADDGPNMPPDNALHGVLPPGVTLTEDGIAKFMGLSRKTAVNNVIYADVEEAVAPRRGLAEGEPNGVACVPVGNKFFVRKAALDKWIEDREAPMARPGNRGGKRTPKAK